MKIVVTGAGGFSGSHIVPALLADGHHVTAVVGSTRGRLDPALDGDPFLSVVSGNLAAGVSLPTEIDVIVHTAARSPGPGVRDIDMVRDNVAATARLLDDTQKAGVGTFIYLSSLSIYGRIAGPTVDETTARVDPDAYGLTKYLGELMLRETTMRSLSIRLPGVLGPKSVRNWLTNVCEAASRDQPIAVYNPDVPFNNSMHINDLCTLIGHVIGRPDWSGHDAVTVGAAGMTTVRGAVQTVIDVTGSRSVIALKHSSQPGFTISSERASARYGYAPMLIDDMLRQFATENRG